MASIDAQRSPALWCASADHQDAAARFSTTHPSGVPKPQPPRFFFFFFFFFFRCGSAISDVFQSDSPH